MSEGYVINYDHIIGDQKSPDYIRELASKIKNNGYYSVGDFFKNLYDYEVEELMNFVENGDLFGDDTDDDFVPSPGAEWIVLLGMLLNSAEAGEQINEDNLQYVINATVGLITVTSLYHKGMIECRFENFSIQKDAGKLQIARRVQ
jgi:hypothetical protein